MIHYHGCPLSGPKDSFSRFYRGRHSMVSFAYPDCLPAVADVAQSFVLDNGAFSTWRSGAKFDLQGYVAWVEEWAQHPGYTWCLIPDVIDGTAADNDALLEWWTTHTYRLNGVPVWHFHESEHRLRALAARFDTVALGSSGQWPNPGTDSWWKRLGEVMPAIIDANGRPYCKLHGLRMLNPEIFSRVPFASADSTNAAQNAGSVKRFGMYPAPEPWQRATAIADRIEAYSSAPLWEKPVFPDLVLFA